MRSSRSSREARPTRRSTVSDTAAADRPSRSTRRARSGRDALLLELEDRLEVLLGGVVHLGHRGQDTLSHESRAQDPVVERPRAHASTFGAVARRRPGRPRRARQASARAARPERLRQDHDAAARRRLRATRRRARSCSTAPRSRVRQRFVPPERRRVGVVFQDYALFPHLTVAQNVGYGVRRPRDAHSPRRRDARPRGPRRRRRPACRTSSRAASSSASRSARALAPEPALVLLDEPFSNLDAALRVARPRRGPRDPDAKPARPPCS